MQFSRYLVKSNIIDIQSNDLRGALIELLEVSTARIKEKLDRESLLEALLHRENTMTTYLGNGVAMPHIRTKMKRRYIFAIGWCPNGIHYDGMPEYKEVKFIFLFLASEEGKNYLSILASLARQFQEKPLVDHVLDAPDLTTFRERILQGSGGLLAKPGHKQNRFNQLLLKETLIIAKAAKCKAVLFFSDTFIGEINVTETLPRIKVIKVTRMASSELKQEGKNVEAAIVVRSFSNQRLSQLRSAVLIGLTKGIFKYNDRLCCIGGVPHSNQLDTLVVIDLKREFQSVLTREVDLLPASVKVEVIERIIAIATDLAIEGREGRSVGCLFVIGDTQKINPMVKPLVLNPFHGYKEEDRNVLNPFMDETIMEYSSIDGAFIIRGDGVIDSAGSLLHAPAPFYQNMPSGLGARHSVASAISRAVDCIAIVVSASSGQVTLFRRGGMLPLIQKSAGRL